MSLLGSLAAAALANVAAPANTTVDGTAIAVHVDSASDQRTVEIALSDAATGAPLRDAQPLGWLYPDEAGVSCAAMIGKAVNASLGSPAVNLNAVRIVAAFADGSLGLIDPQTSFGGTQLESALELGGRARAIAASAKGDRLAVLTEAGRLQLVETSGALRRNADIALAPDSAIGWEGSHLLAAGDGRFAEVDGTDGQVISEQRWSFIGHPILRQAAGKGVLVSSESGTLGIRLDGSSVLSAVTGIVGMRDALWLAKPAAWLVADMQGKLALLRPGSEPQWLTGVTGVRALGADAEGRFILAVVSDGKELALLDAADSRVLDRRPLAEPADAITVSRDFAYVHSARSANVQLIAFEVMRRQQRIATVDLPFGSEHAASASPFARVGIMPGGAAIIGQDGTTLYAYAEGMMVPMGSFAGISRPLVGVAVLDRSLRETRPGVYRAGARVPFGGKYRVPLRIGNPRIDACLTIDLPGPAHSQPALAGVAHFASPQLAAHPGDDLSVSLSAPIRANRIIALATDTLGQWQRHFPLERDGGGNFTGRLKFPRPGAYRLIALDARASVSINAVSIVAEVTP